MNHTSIFIQSLQRRKPDLYQFIPRLLFVLAFLFVSTAHVFAVTKTFTGPGNFSDATKWNGNSLPAAGDILRINGACTVNNSPLTDNVAYGALTIGFGLVGTLTWPAGGTNRLNVTNINSILAGLNALNMTNGGILIIKGTIVTGNLTFTPGTGTIEAQNPSIVNTYGSFGSLILNTGGTVNASGNLTVNGNLTITSGTLSVGGFNLSVTGTTTVTSTLAITSTTGSKSFGTLIINGTFSNTANDAITIAKNLTNNGTFSQGIGRVTFTGAASNTISGTAATTAFGGGITVNKGTSTSSILDVQCVITLLNGGLTLTNGTFKLSSNSTIAPFPNTAGAIIPATAGLWNDGGTMNSPASMDWTINGYLRCSGGTVNVGMIGDDQLLPQSGSAITIDGGTLNVAGCMLIFVPAVFTMSGGTMNVGTVGSTATTSLPPFSIGDTLATFNMSGGTIVIVHPCDPGGLNYGFYNLAKTYTVTGGTLRIGNGSTYAGEIIRVNSTVPLYDLLVNSVNVTARLSPLLTTTIVVDHNVTIAAGILDANDKYLNIGGDWINNGNFLPTTTSVTFNGTGTHTVTGTSTTNFNAVEVDMGTNFTSNILDVQSLITMPSGGLTLTNGTFKLSSNSTIIPFITDITVAPYRIPGTAGLWVNGGTVSTQVNVTAAGLVRVSNGTLNVGNAVDESLLTAWATMIIEGGAVNISGTFTRRVAAEGAYYSMTGGTLTVPTMGSTSTTISPFTLDNAGSSFTMSGGTIIIERSGGTGVSTLGYVNLAGTSNVTGGTLQIGSASTPLTQTIPINSSARIGNLTINAANSPVGKLTTNSLTVVNDVTISGGTLNANNLNFTLGGDWTKALASVYTQGTGTVTFTGNAAQSINGTATSQTFNHVVVSKTAGTLLNTGGSTVTLTTNNLTETTGNFTAPATLNINGNFLLSAGTFTAGTTTNILGNWTKNGGTFTSGTYVVNFTGTATKTLGGSDVSQFYNLTINTTASADKVQLTNDAIASNVLTLTKGVFDLNSNTLFIWNSANAAITRTTGYILSEKTDNSSKICWNIKTSAGAHIYPFGTVGGIYIPFTLTRADGDLGQVTVSTYPTTYLNTPYPATPVLVTNMYSSTGSDNSPNVVDRFWQIDKEGLIALSTFTFTATPAEMGSITFPKAQRYESSTNKWQAPLAGQTNPTATSVTVPGVTKFSPWTLSGNGAMLPIELLDFTAVLNKAQVDINWSTAAELNNDYFTLEKTYDLVNYEAVTIVDGAGNSTHSLTYFTPDINPYSGVSYYRLKQTDFNGTETYSKVVSVSIDSSPADFIAYPNPMIGTTINVKLPDESIEEMQVIIYSMNGQEVFTKKITANADRSFTVNTEGTEKFSTGMYLLTLISDKGSYQKKLIIQ